MKQLVLFICTFSFFTLYSQNQIGSDIEGDQFDRSGASVSMSSDGKRLVIGATQEIDPSKSGYVSIYEESGGVWSQIGSDINGISARDAFGRSVSMSSDGKRVIIGATQDVGPADGSGYVQIYEESLGSWTQIGSNIVGEANYDLFGGSVSISSNGTRVAIGAEENASNGSVKIYEYNGVAWTQLGSKINGEATGDNSGSSVSLSSDGARVAIGARLNDGAGSGAGHVRIFEYNGVAWTQVGSDIDGEAASDQSGGSVSLSSDGTRVAIGARLNDGIGGSSSRIGHVRIFEESTSGWAQVGSNIDGEAVDDWSGVSVSLSSDGKKVAIGSQRNSTYTGHVRIYEETMGIWTQFGVDIDGEAAGDNSGGAVSLSSDGTRVAIGAPSNSGSSNKGTSNKASDAGHVRIFNDNVLPIELISFQGKLKEKNVLLNWQTASELNNRGFELQKSINGIDWEVLSFINGQGNSVEVNKYQYLDQHPFTGVNYYRLKQIDFDAAFEYSKIIAVKYDRPQEAIQVFPNPSNGVINLQIENPSNQTITVNISDNLGRIIWKSTSIEGELNWAEAIEVEETGVYHVNGQVGTERFYKRVLVYSVE